MLARECNEERTRWRCHCHTANTQLVYLRMFCQFEFVFRLVRLFGWAHTLSHNNNNNKKKKKVGPCLVYPLSVCVDVSLSLVLSVVSGAARVWLH